MRGLRFLVKFSFICNICYLLSFIVRMTGYDKSMEDVVNHILVLGYVVCPYLNVLTFLVALILLLMKKLQWRNAHPYIFILNVLIFLVQLTTSL